jgi:hypothetical protein
VSSRPGMTAPFSGAKAAAGRPLDKRLSVSAGRPFFEHQEDQRYESRSMLDGRQS